MRKLTTTARDELRNALARRCAVGTRDEKTRILDEFVAIRLCASSCAKRECMGCG